MYILKRKHPLYGYQGNTYSDSDFKSLIPTQNHHLFEYRDDDDCDGNEYQTAEEFDYELEEDI